MAEVSTEVAKWLLGAVGAYKIFESIIMKRAEKKEKEENSQSSEIETLKRRCECIEKEIIIIQAEKVSRQELDKKLGKIETDVTEIKLGMVEIKGYFKNREEN